MKFLMRLSSLNACVLLLMGSVMGQEEPALTSKAVSLRGRVVSVNIKQIDRSSALIDIKLKMEFANTGARPIIFLQREPLFPGGGLAKKPEDFAAGNLLAADAGWPANESSDEWTTLRASLDKPTPPPNETRLLGPNESWSLETSVRLVVPTDLARYTSSRKKQSLATIQQLSPVWLQVVCEVWPWNLEPLDAERNQLKFGRKLQERWKDVGWLWLDEIYSEPIRIDVRSTYSNCDNASK